jgi:gamma-glutamyltranspeptidase/glutathione hydrolase
MLRKKRIIFCSRTVGLTFLSIWLSHALWAASLAPVQSPRAMVVSAQHLATKVGVEILKRGGNSVDAAVAVAYALAVVYPAAGNLGGGGFMTIKLSGGIETFLDFREAAPLASSVNMYLNAEGQVIKDLSTRGHLAVGVPGTVSGLEYARKKYGSMTRKDLLAPAIALAEKGFVLQSGDVSMLEVATEDFKKDSDASFIFLKGKKPFQVGERLVQKQLASTLKRIQQKGEFDFYQGKTAQLISKASLSGGGLITLEDLAAYQTREFKPIECNYRGYRILSAPPPSSGGVIICEILKILEPYPLKEWGYHSAQSLHFQIEAIRRGYVDRNTLLGDPGFHDNPIAEILSPARIEKLRNDIKPMTATPSNQLLPSRFVNEGENTTHFSIVDQSGNAVSMTYTLNDWFGARVMAKGTGFLLNNEMDDFTVKLGEVNHYQLLQGRVNQIQASKRPLSSMSPTIVLKDGRVAMVLGTPGGSRIITAVLQTLINTIDYDMNIQEAVDAPRYHHQWVPDVVFAEEYAISADTQDKLREWGYTIKPSRLANHLAAIMVGGSRLSEIKPNSSALFGANDPRRNTGLALGY